MAFKRLKRLPSAEEIINNIPLSSDGYLSITQHQEEIKNILSGKDNRLLVIIGPCSAWPAPAVVEYAKKLIKLNKLIKHSIKIVMRVYIQKPRTRTGWAGPLTQPDPLLPPDITTGMYYTRKMMVDIVSIGMPIADEALFTHNTRGFIELLSWVAIGARSSEDQEHRVFASSINCPVGMKNPTNGSIKIGVNGVISAQHSHVAIFDGFEIETSGNKYAHLVLRGGDNKPNYSIEHITNAINDMQENNVANPAIIIDVSHDNCLINNKKEYSQQDKIIFDIMENIKQNPTIKPFVKGFMIESFLKDGKQTIDKLNNTLDFEGLSITDPCIGFEQTKDLLLKLADLHNAIK